MIRSRRQQRFWGLCMAAVAIPLYISQWRWAMNTGDYSLEIAGLLALLAVGGLGSTLFPIDYDRLQAEHGVDRIKVFRHLPKDRKVLFFVALVVGLAGAGAIAIFAPPPGVHGNGPTQTPTQTPTPRPNSHRSRVSFFLSESKIATYSSTSLKLRDVSKNSNDASVLGA
jgi:hypothetical protein